MDSLKEGLKILLYMQNSDWLTQCWVLNSLQVLITMKPKYKNEIISFLNDFHSEREEVRLKIYEIKNLPIEN